MEYSSLLPFTPGDPRLHIYKYWPRKVTLGPKWIITLEILATSQCGLPVSTCVVISMYLRGFISAPAVCLRLTCLPAPCVKCLWPKKAPCGCVLLCLLAAGVWRRGQGPCQHSPSANVLAALLVRSPGGGYQEKKQQQTPLEHTHWHRLVPKNTFVSVTLLTALVHQHAATAEADGTGEDADDRGQSLTLNRLNDLMMFNNGNNYLSSLKTFTGVRMTITTVIISCVFV